jgi:hypothetical protein
MMKQLVFVLAASLMTSFLACSAKDGNRDKNGIMKTDSIVQKALGDSIADVLFNPKKVNCYRLKVVEKVEEGQVVAEKFDNGEVCVRDGFVCSLTDKEKTLLQYLLLADPKNYEQAKPVIRSPYIPMIEFEFIKKKEIVRVLISTTDFSWTIIYKGKVMSNWNYTDRSAINRVCSDLFNSVKPQTKEDKK